ncbi:diguanylate cyclase [Actinokineospora sp. NBRC 105648]|uniref:diguanylate cyclase domain-containing protein n=1 Tax=Actinokineospora sp. NBRC 105648 TaxID=3032206 RepID=UPI002555B756|nr:diguanylate cyclase [Actinokineospora sp. NBRC 105648]
MASTAYVPRSSTEVRALLRGLLGRLTDALAAEPFDAASGAVVGELMVDGALTGELTLERSIGVLADGLVAAGHDARAVVRLLAGVSAGYAAALRKRTLRQQENMKLALLTAKQRAERDRRDTENRFRGVFTASAIGIAITEPDGRFVETNPALANILGCAADELADRSLSDFLAEDDAEGRPLGPEADRRRLRRPNGDTAWVYLTTTMLPADDGRQRYRVTMVQDLSELQLLGNQLSHQNLHDALTGLANRLHFESRLEAMHGQAPPGGALTLLCLDLDAFSLVNTTHGHHAGDRLLQTVARRLSSVVADRAALVARIGGDEFAVLIAHGPVVPSVSELVGEFNAELAEPDYDGRRGLAVSATFGAVRCTPEEMSSTEMFRAADAALRHARSTGRCQWTEYDAHADRAARKVAAAATALPAAWENGELAVVYEPVVRLADRRTVRVRALVHTTSTRDGVDTATELAELTGLAVALGPWLVEQSTPGLPVWRSLFAPVADPGEAVHRVLLSASQSADADLSGTLNRAIDQAGVPAGLLEVGLDTTTVLARGDAQDNLRTLGDIGVVTALHGFTGGPREIALVERFGVRTVVLADPFEGWRPDWLPSEAVPVRATLALISELGSVGAAVGVLGVRDLAEARWWADQGVRTGEGPAFGGPGDTDDILARIRLAAN